MLPLATEAAPSSLAESAEHAGVKQPQMLCEVCRNLDYALVPECRNTIQANRRSWQGWAHHTTFQGLQRAATAGCGYCVIFRQALIDAYKHHTGWDKGRIVHYHSLRDSAGGGHFFLGRSAEKSWLDKRFCSRRLREDSGFSLALWREVELTRDDKGISVQGLGVDLVDTYGFEIAPTAYVAITSLSGNHTQVIGRQVSREAPLDLCCSWLESCCNSHVDCAPVKDSTMPTRLIEVGKHGCSNPKLVECTGLTGLYVTLSHVWGGQQPLVTTSQNYHQHLREIPNDALPRTFQDAFTVTRMLGYRYIWIDSLCIIQDSEADWQAECAMMERIYEECALTIAGPDAVSPHAGFLHERPLPSVAPCTIPDSDCDISMRNDLAIGIAVIPYFEGLSLENWTTGSLKGSHTVLDSRAWTLQERLLSPRVIFFGANQIYYECRTTVYFECCWYPLENHAAFGQAVYPTKRARYEDLRKRKLSGDGTVRRNWRKVVEFYTGCKLSRPSDKLAALGGLARRFSRGFSTQYLAGLWRDSLFKDLIWIRDPHRGPASHYDANYIAPSWSWASTDGPIKFLCEDEDTTSHFTCLEAQVQYAGLDQFNRVSAGRLVLLGHVRELAVGSYSDEESCYDLFDPDLQQLDEAIGFCHLDAPPAQALGEGSRLAQLCFLVACHDSWRSPSARWWALAINRSPTSPDLFNRVGVAQDGASLWEVDRQLEKWEASEMQRITII